MAEPRAPINTELLLSQTGWIRRLAGSLIRDPALADDLAQDTLLAALEAPPARVESEQKLRAWLRRVLQNLAALTHRREVRRRDRDRTAGRRESVPSVHEVIEQGVLQKQLVGAVMDLPEPERVTVLLRYFHELDNAGVAARLGISPGAVRTRLSRALHKLRQALEQAPEGRRGDWMQGLVLLARGRASPPPAVPSPPPGWWRIGLGTALGGALLCWALFPGEASRDTWDPRHQPSSLTAARIQYDADLELAEVSWELIMGGEISDWRPPRKTTISVGEHITVRELRFEDYEVTGHIDSPRRHAPIPSTAVVTPRRPHSSRAAPAALDGGLPANLGLEELLPAEEVSIGATWQVPASSLSSALAPFGEAHYLPDAEELPPPLLPELFHRHSWFSTELSGQVQARFTGFRDAGNRSLAVVHLDILAGNFLRIPGESGPTAFASRIMLRSVTERVHLQAEGELAWDVARGQLHSLDLSGQVELVIEVEQGRGPRDDRIEQHIIMEGPIGVHVARGGSP